MAKRYKHFDHKERTLSSWWRKEHLSLREMGRRLRRSHTSMVFPRFHGRVKEDC
jgi:IS30 family transposase